MTEYRHELPAGWNGRIPDDAPEMVSAYLATQGITATVAIYNPPPPAPPVSVGGGLITISESLPTHPPSLLIEADADPTQALQNWIPGKSNFEKAIDELRAQRQAIKAKPQAQWTQQERFVMAVTTVLRDIGD